MKSVAVLRFTQTEGPGYLADFLSRHNIPQIHINVDMGHPIPESVNDFSGLVLMGGPMSANDGLLWIPQVFDLIRQAVDQSVPVLGHCLGGQLMSKALGGSITQNPVKEIGWGKVNKVDDSLAVDWLGPLPYQFEVFQWHGETFSIPPRAQRLLENSYCTNQAFLLNNKHLALQCHIEMTEAMIKAWCEVGSDEISNAKSSPAVESPSVIQANMSSRVKQLNTIADVIYGRWIQGFHSSESIKL